MRDHSIDKIFLALVLFLVLGGFFIFISASLGLLARDGATFGAIAFNQFFFGLFLGSLFLIWMTKIPHTFWKHYALHIFLFSLVLTALVFVPQLNLEHGGAKRWLLFGSFSFQPAEFLKFGVVLYLSAWFSSVKAKVGTFRFGFLPLLAVVGLAGILLLLQPDTGTFIVVLATAISMFLIAGGRWKHLAILVGGILIGAALLVFMRPYLMDRVMTFVDPSRDPMGSGWQIQQALIAVGSGGVAGRGFGQSIQKFNFLPEPIGDSIFAVAAEEFGFVGAIALIALFILFLLRGLYIARRAPDSFSGLLVAGIVIMIVAQSFLNIASLIGVMPLTGLPLIFVSHGGSALLVALAEIGIVLGISRHQRKL